MLLGAKISGSVSCNTIRLEKGHNGCLAYGRHLTNLAWVARMGEIKECILSNG